MKTRPASLLKRHAVSLLPTPLHFLPRLSKHLGYEIFCKRDDLTGFAFGGNKTRKLDYLLIDAESRHVDTLIAIGGMQSNFARIVAAVGASYGYGVHLVLGGKSARATGGNVMLDRLFGATIHEVESDDWRAWEDAAAALETKLTSEGKRVDALPIGGSTPVGALGYVNAFIEIMEDAMRLKTRFDVIVHATSSGGTQAGLLVGKSLTSWEGQIMGVGVAKHSNLLQDEILTLSTKMANVFGVEIHRPDIIVDDAHQGEGYGIPTSQADEAIDLFARLEGIMLDHVYTGKAAAALIEYCRKGRFEKGQRLLFLHTGGNVELFAAR